MPIDFQLNPDLMRTRSQKFKDPRWDGGKYYLAIFSQNGLVKAGRKQFRRASEAEQYGKDVLQRLRILQAAAALKGENDEH